MFYATTTRKCLPRIFVCPSVTLYSYLGTYVLTRYVCSDTLSLTSDDINYADRGAADPRRCNFSCGFSSKQAYTRADFFDVYGDYVKWESAQPAPRGGD